MKYKTKIFDVPFIGYDLGEKHGWTFDVLIGKYGNPVIGIKIKNAVEQYSADPESYMNFHSLLNQIIAIVGEGFIIQKTDIFSKKKYLAEPSKEFLQQKYSEHFDGRYFKTIDTLLLFTDLIDDKSKKKNKYKFDENRYKILREKCQKVLMLLNQHDCPASFLKKKDFDYYIDRAFTMKFSDIPTFDNYKIMDTYIKVGNDFIKTISFVDVEDIALPNTISPFSYLGGTGVASETAIDNFSFFNELEDYNSIIYNQVISIPIQGKRQTDLEKKKKKHESAGSQSPSNLLIAEEIDELMVDVATNSQLIVDAHFSIAFSTEDKDKMEKLYSQIESKLFTKGIRISKRTTNQLELFRSCIPGNAVELKDYDFFMTTSEGASCFFFKESFPISEESNIYLRFTDRQGVPLKVDFCDLPMKTGRINNRNKFVLGPSGSGKSFLMNNIVEQYLTYNYDVVIVDTGDSYSGTCKYKGGKYIKYTEENPITMNPFIMNEKEFNIEKIEFLTNLIFMIWQGADATMTKEQKSILDNTLVSYYNQYFNQGKNWYESKSNEDLLLHLEKYNIHREELLEDFEEDLEQSKTYYEILNVSENATTDEIKRKGRKLINFYHPDKNIDNPDYNQDIFHRVYEAYETLIDEEKRKRYNETTLAVITSEVIKKSLNAEDWNDAFRYSLIKRIKELDDKLVVSELSFNSFYEYCERFLPIYLKNKKYKITEKEFNLRTFLFVLKDFYKGGRYGTTLNESADSTLFDEPFIVFEIDNVKDNPTLFPIVTLIIMDTFIQKMRLRNDRRKALIIEEAWKAIASKLMGGYILYLYKTVRKFWGETVVVTQELNDIIGNAVVKDSIISNSDTFILLDQSKFKDSFEDIADILSLNKIEQNKIWTINNLNNKNGRARFKEFYIKRGSKGEVYGNEVSLEQYLTYTTEKPEKSAIEYYFKSLGSYDDALNSFVLDSKKIGDLDILVALVNLNKKPMDDTVIKCFKDFQKRYKGQNILKIIEQEMESRNISFNQLIKEAV
ncbi:TraG/VirB4 family ATPase [Riemerella anatipestifer]|uniref:DnaJ domain-containing protein n=1 Tax=Riemerella anatipestifer TaxID=34085 RepID=A0AAP6HCR8_RIEAN|nr:DnaJ domain-containing protein [Riemerella anatipestifer]MCO7354030.1 DnaJ domain-containing protein [Riemerella anatipestifer]MCU7559140.1 DnaJ domain-containing protein [Riemerella anatipestifer]MCU7571130.1 DnaJ domain-containing protein [Riemerella anatipestifer]MCU7597593.1 DnaJ domain-containing protein [Riemerella anatipestifer]MCW0494202.1 DnaJ domain-containing protein [Riemerella anatipestifer]